MTVGSGVRAITRAIEQATGKIAAFRATVTAVDGSLITVQGEGAATANTEQYASCTRFLLAVGDVVLCIPLGGKPVVIDVIRRAAAATPTGVLSANAGSTATKTITGRDEEFELEIASSGAGQATGTQIDITFAVARPSANYNVMVSPKSSAARSLGGVVGQSTVATTHFTFASNTALTAGSTYLWGLSVRMYAN